MQQHKDKSVTVLSRLTVIIFSSLAHYSHDSMGGSDIVEFLRMGLPQVNRTSGSSKYFSGKDSLNSRSTRNNSKPSEFEASGNKIDSNASTATVCAWHVDPCSELHSLVSYSMVLAPFAIALISFIVGSLPTVFLRSRYRVFGVRSCIWVLIELWIHLSIAFSWFILDENRAQAYAWALHSSTYILSSWQPRKNVIVHCGLQRIVSSVGAACVVLFAWHFGPPIGIAAWDRHSDAQCGWIVHLTAVMGVDLLGWVLGPIEWFVVG